MDFILGLALVIQTLLSPNETIPCSTFPVWDAMMVEGKQVSGQNVVAMSQAWTRVNATGMRCGPGQRNTIVAMCASAPGELTTLLFPEKQMVVNQFVGMIPVEVGVAVECTPDTLNSVFLPAIHN